MQDVNFRSFLKAKASDLGLVGFVRNEPDGTVYTEAEGDEGDLREFLDQCRQGPRFARVEKVDIQEGKMQDFKLFEIKY